MLYNVPKQNIWNGHISKNMSKTLNTGKKSNIVQLEVRYQK